MTNRFIDIMTQHKWMDRVGKYSGKPALCAVFLAVCILAGCGNEESGVTDLDSIKVEMSKVPSSGADQETNGAGIGDTDQNVEGNENPVATEAPVVTEAPVTTEAPVVTEEPQGTPEPVATEVPDPAYPALKADGYGWGLKYSGSGKQPGGNEKVSVLEAYHAYFLGSAEKNDIYLTFDCGYENGNTESILATLKEKDVKATFFVTGPFLEQNGDLAKKMIEGGHTVGNHTYNHPDITKIDKETFREELTSVQNKFREVTGSELSMYFRPPEGKCAQTSLRWAKDMGYATILWSTAHVDWNTDNQPTHEKALETLKERIHPGAVVLLHNTSKTNAEVLGKLIDMWVGMGYAIKPLSELVGH